MNELFLEDQHLLLLPVIAALIGWITNWLAVKMLFRPKKRISFLLFSVQGVFPKRQQALAHKLGSIVSQELFSAEDVKRTLKEAGKSDDIMLMINKKIEGVITGKLPQAIPMLSMVMTPELISIVTGAFKSELSEVIDGVIEELGDSLDSALDVHAIVEQKVAAFSSEKLERLLISVMKKEFRFIEIIGAVLGFVIGSIQVLLVKYPDPLLSLIK